MASTSSDDFTRVEPKYKPKFWGKVLAHDSERSLVTNFRRQVELHNAVEIVGLIPLVQACLDSPRPMLVYPFVKAQTLSDWLNSRAQLPATVTLLQVIYQTLESLNAIHQAGMCHGQIDPEHILITDCDQSVRIVGLSCVEPIGCFTCLPRLSTSFDAPEVRANEFEVSSAIDVFSLGMTMIHLFGHNAATWPIVKAMTAKRVDDRPTSADLMTLVADLRLRAEGWSYSINDEFSSRAA